MARLALVLVSLAALAVPRAEAAPLQQLSRADVTFDAAVPCGMVCPYVVDGQVEEVSWLRARTSRDPSIEACRPSPLSPPGSWDDHVVTVPAQIGAHVPRLLVLDLYPYVDYDAFLCMVADAGTPAETWAPVRDSCFYCWRIWPECYVGLHHTGLGCQERIVTTVEPGQTLVLRAFNQADFAPAQGMYRYFG